MAVMHGPEDRTVPGNTAVMQEDKPFSALSRYSLFLIFLSSSSDTLSYYKYQIWGRVSEQISSVNSECTTP